jgi:putative oxidoreductase
MNALSCLARFYYRASHWPEYLSPVLDLGLRLYLANVFFKSGLTKVSTWDSTLYLFSDVYHVPLLPPAVAATMAASAGINQHISWGILLAVLLILSRGNWSIDAWLERRLRTA